MSKEIIETLRSDLHFGGLPDSIRIPALGNNQNEVIKPTELATLDDIAFAILGLDAEVEALNNRHYALRRLYRLARAKGAIGDQNAVDVVSSDKGGV
jgi:hypothetical protein